MRIQKGKLKLALTFRLPLGRNIVILSLAVIYLSLLFLDTQVGLKSSSELTVIADSPKINDTSRGRSFIQKVQTNSSFSNDTNELMLGNTSNVIQDAEENLVLA